MRSWAAFYRAVQADRIERMSDMLGVMHPKNPKQVQQRLRQMMADVLSTPKTPVVADVERFKRMMQQKGVRVEEKPDG